MGAISMNLPAIYMPAGPDAARQLARRAARLGHATRGSTGRSCARARSTSRRWQEVEEGIARSFGHCMMMGTASTMTSVAETLGLTLPGAASIPAADANHARMARMSGRRIVEMVWEDLKPTDMLTPQVVRQRDHGDARAVRLHQRDHPSDRDGGPRRHRARPRTVSTSSRAHAGARQHAAGRRKYLMEDFYYAGGLRALLGEIAPTAEARLPDRERQDAGREHRRGEDLQRRRHPHAQQPAVAERRAGGAARQSRAGRRGDQAHCRRSRTC